ncbi:MAG: chalcone isomerase family protein [Sinobacterium sp.]|nr:chalcone isomerase family protein [Sinobacterium sp.]
MRCNLISTLGTLLFIATLNFSHTTLAGENLELSGIASYSKFNKEVYLASLWLERKANNSEDISTLKGGKRMEIRVTVKKWRQRNFSKMWSQGIIINNSDEFTEKFGQEINAFSTMLKGPLLYGDHIIIELMPNKLVTVSINNTKLFKTPKTEFFTGLLNAWIGNKPPSSEFKQSITHLDKQNTQTIQNIERNTQITPANPAQRNKQIRQWVATATPKAKRKTEAKPKAIPAPPKVLVPATATALAPTPAKKKIATEPKPVTKKTVVKTQAPNVKAASTAATQTISTPKAKDTAIKTDTRKPEAPKTQGAPIKNTQIADTATALPKKHITQEKLPAKENISLAITLSPEQKLANAVNTAKAVLANKALAQKKVTTEEESAAEVNFDKLISQLESEQPQENSK